MTNAERFAQTFVRNAERRREREAIEIAVYALAESFLAANPEAKVVLVAAAFSDVTSALWSMDGA